MNLVGVTGRRVFLGALLAWAGCGRAPSQNLSKDAASDPEHFAKVRAESEARTKAQLEAERKRFGKQLKNLEMP